MKNRNSTKVLPLLLVFLMVISIFQVDLYAKTDTSYLKKIEGVLKLLPDSDDVEFIVTMKKEVDLEDVRPDEVVDALKETSEKSQEKLLSFIERKVKEGKISEFNSFYIINSIFIKGKAELLSQIAKRDDVLSIRANHKVVADKEEVVKAVSSLSETSYVPWNLESIQADRVNKTGAGVVVGIIDSGVNPNHPELQGAMVDGGFKDFVDTSNTTPKDSTGHGTHVAGTILGRTIGVAKDAKFIAARVFNDDGEASDDALLKAGQWILEQKPNVVNNSWGGNRDDEFYKEIVVKWREAGIVPIFSSGNAGLFNIGGDGSIGSPASLEGTFSVGALTKDDRIAKFSLRGPSKFTKNIKPEISAPGVNILSANHEGGYILKTGTSMAAPHVTGAVAVMLEANPSLSLTQVEDILKKTATPLKDNYYITSPNMGYGHGKLNVFKAVAVALGKDVDTFATFTGRTLISGTDNELPTIKATTPAKFYNAYDFELEAKVSDNVGVKSVTLYYKNQGIQEFSAKPFQMDSGNKKDGTYSVTILPDELNTASVEYYIEAVDQSGNSFRTKNIVASVESGIKVDYFNDFESNADGFVFGGKTPMWEVGVPSVGPTENIPSGKNVVGTRLSGNYEGLINSLLISPPIDLSVESRDTVVKFKEWSELDNHMGGIEDSAEVWIGEIDTANPRIANIKYENGPALINRYSKRFWREKIIDLSPYKGKKIVVMFALRWAGGSDRDALGYYIDDFKLEALTNDVPLPPSQNMTIENNAGSGKIRIRFDKVENPLVSKYVLYRSKAEHGVYEKIKEDTPPIDDYPTPQEGSYYYKVTSKKGSTESEMSKALSVTFTVGELFKKFDFEDGDQGWTSPSTHKWVRGEVDQEYDTPGPNPIFNPKFSPKNPDSPHVFATGLNKKIERNQVYELVSPVIDLSTLKSANLYYQNWYSSTDEVGEIWFKTDGRDWTKKFNLTEKFNENNINNHERSKNAWGIDGIEIPTDYLKSSFQMKFVLRSSYSYNEPGWYIDDVAIYNTSKVAPPVTIGEEEIHAVTEVAETEVAETEVAETEAFKVTSEKEETSEEVENITPPSTEDSKFTLHGMTLYEAAPPTPAEASTVPVSATVKILDTNTYVKSELGTGIFEIKHPSGTYQAIAYNDEFKSRPFEIVLTDSGRFEKDIVLSSLSTYGLSFNLKDNAGNPVKADVKIYEKGSSIPKYISTSKATVILADIPEGEYKIIVLANGFKTHERNIRITDNTSLGDIVLQRIQTSGEKKEIAGDSGNFTDAKVLAPLKDGATVSVKYHFAEESILKTLRFGFKKSSLNSIVGKEFRYSIYAENKQDGYPGEILLGPLTATVQADNDFTTVAIPDLFVKGSVYLAYTQVGAGDDVPRIAVDESNMGEGKIHKLINGAWNAGSELGMYMIRTEVEKVADGPSSTPPSINQGSSPSVSGSPSYAEPEKKEEKKEEKKPEKTEVKPTPVEEKLMKQLEVLEEKLNLIAKLENKIKSLEKAAKKTAKKSDSKTKNKEEAKPSKKSTSTTIKTFVKKAKKSLSVKLNNFTKTNDFDDIKVKIKGLKQGKDFEVFFKKEKNHIKVMIVGKGKLKGTIVKKIKIKK